MFEGLFNSISSNQSGWSTSLTMLALFGIHFFVKFFILRLPQVPVERKRALAVLERNVLIGVGIVSVLFIWGGTLNLFALSVAAVAGALILVSRDSVVSIQAYLSRFVFGSVKVGDRIQVGTMQGELIDYSLLTFTLLETGKCWQATGKIVVLPNSILFTEGVRLVQSAGGFVLSNLDVFCKESEVVRCKEFLLQAANEACSEWRKEAIEAFNVVRGRHFVDVPSGNPKVFIGYLEDKGVVLTLRYPSRDDLTVALGEKIKERYIGLTMDWLSTEKGASSEKQAGC